MSGIVVPILLLTGGIAWLFSGMTGEVPHPELDPDIKIQDEIPSSSVPTTVIDQTVQSSPPTIRSLSIEDYSTHSPPRPGGTPDRIKSGSVRERQHSLFEPKADEGVKKIQSSMFSMEDVKVGVSVDVDYKDDDGNTELHLAAGRGDEDTVRRLIQLGAYVNARNDLKETPLHKAAFKASENCTSCLNIVDFLIEQGANVNVRGRFGRIFLHFLLWSGTEITPSQLHQVAKKYGHLFNIRDWAGESPLDLAMSNVEVEVATLVQLWREGVSFTEVDGYGETVLAFAVKGHQSVDVLEKLIALGADYRGLDRRNSSLLHVATASGNAEALSFLIEKGGLDINDVDRDGCAPLHLIGRDKTQTGKQLEVVHLLLDNGADKTVKNKKGESPHERVSTYEDFPDKDKVLELLLP